MSEGVSAETGQFVRVHAPGVHLVVRLPDGKMLPLEGQRMRVLEVTEFGWLCRPDPWPFPPEAWPSAWWLDRSRFDLEK